MKTETSELLYDRNPNTIETLFKIYKENPYHARVYFMNSRNSEEFEQHRIIIFEDGDDFDVVYFIKSFGISKINRSYSNERVLFRLRCRASGVWVTYKKSIRAFMANDSILHHMNSDVRDIIQYKLSERFAWYRFMREDFSAQADRRSLNYFIKNKLYDKKSILKKFYGFDLPLCKVLYDIDCKATSYNRNDMTKLQYYKDWISNENKFNPDLTGEEWMVFHDTLKMAKRLDRKVNFRWDLKRLKAEHAQMSKDLTNIVILYDEADLNVGEMFIDYGEKYDRPWIKSGQALAREGQSQSHCVVSYKSNINAGESGIYHIDGYTLELRIRGGCLYIAQFRGLRNQNAPLELREKINEELKEFNKNSKYKKYPSTDIPEFGMAIPIEQGVVNDLWA